MDDRRTNANANDSTNERVLSHNVLMPLVREWNDVVAIATDFVTGVGNWNEEPAVWTDDIGCCFRDQFTSETSGVDSGFSNESHVPWFVARSLEAFR